MARSWALSPTNLKEPNSANNRMSLEVDSLLAVPSDVSSALDDTLTAASGQTLNRGPRGAMPRCLTTHCDDNGCCFKPLSFVIVCYIARDNEYTVLFTNGIILICSFVYTCIKFLSYKGRSKRRNTRPVWGSKVGGFSVTEYCRSGTQQCPCLTDFLYATIQLHLTFKNKCKKAIKTSKGPKARPSAWSQKPWDGQHLCELCSWWVT